MENLCRLGGTAYLIIIMNNNFINLKFRINSIENLLLLF